MYVLLRIFVGTGTNIILVVDYHIIMTGTEMKAKHLDLIFLGLVFRALTIVILLTDVAGVGNMICCLR